MDEIWKSMQMEDTAVKKKYEQRTAAIKKKSGFEMESVCVPDKSGGAKTKRQSKSGDKKKKEEGFGYGYGSITSSSSSFKKENRNKGKADTANIFMLAGLNLSDKSSTAVVKKEEVKAMAHAKTITADEMNTLIARDVSAVGDADVVLRRRALDNLYKILFVEYTMSKIHYSEIFHDISRNIFKCFADSVEKCRDMSLQITAKFFENCNDVVSSLGYFMPALMARLRPGLAYDEEMKVFVYDLEEHEAFRRGKAVDRQDRQGSVTPGATTIVEPSEELRLRLVTTLGTLVYTLSDASAMSMLNPYFHECIMFLQAQLRDPFSDVKVAACDLLVVFAQNEEFEIGMKFFACALCRALLPPLRHRHAKVRAAACRALHYCMIVKDRAKVRGAGTEAIMDLVGFREENVLPVAAFYIDAIQINYLAELVSDKSALVREQLVLMLHSLLTEIGDRYDHQQRLLPYLLDLLSDETTVVATNALKTLYRCGQQYEEEHHDDIIEKRQYGVDGDERINLQKPPPAPFKERPRIGVRLYVRGNTKRFLSALVAELTNWISKTRVKSAFLLRTIIFLCEEHLTMEAHKLFPNYIKSLVFAKNDKDKELKDILMNIFELVGRFTPVDIYLVYVLPRLRGDKDVVQFGVDAATRESVLEFLGALMQGSKASNLAPNFIEIVKTVADPFVIPATSESIRSSALDVILILMEQVQLNTGGGLKAVVESTFLKTGRFNMADLDAAQAALFRCLLEDIAYPAMRDRAARALLLLALVDENVYPPKNVFSEANASGSGPRAMAKVDPLLNLFIRRGPVLVETLVMELTDSYGMIEADSCEIKLLRYLSECPYDVVHANVQASKSYESYLVSAPLAENTRDEEHLQQLASLMCTYIGRSVIDDTVRDEYDVLYIGNDDILKATRPSRCNGPVKISDVIKVIHAYVLNPHLETSIILQESRVSVFLALVENYDLTISVSMNNSGITFESLLKGFVPLVVEPMNPSQLRLNGLLAVEKTLDFILEVRGLGESSVKSFVKQKESGRVESVELTELLATLPNVLDDCANSVRRASLSMLRKVVMLIPPSRSDDVKSPFVLLTDKLLMLGCEALVSEEVCSDPGPNHEEVDILLRMLAVLDPKQMEERVRMMLARGIESESVSVSVSPAKQAKLDFFSSLIGHCDLLAHLAGSSN